MIDITHIFSIGYRCTSAKFLQKYNLRKISGPFDYMFIDIETCFQNINNNFDDYFNDILHFNLKSQINKNLYQKNKLNNICNDLLNYSNIFYMSHNYNDKNIYINLNFMDNVINNLYDWNKICVYIHHDINDEEIYNNLIKRSMRFMDIYNNKKSNVCLFHITKIMENITFEEYKKYIFDLKLKYKISAYIIIIFCSPLINEINLFENNILFISKTVPNYNFQIKNQLGTDNNYDYEKEKNIIFNYFNFTDNLHQP